MHQYSALKASDKPSYCQLRCQSVKWARNLASNLASEMLNLVQICPFLIEMCHLDTLKTLNDLIPTQQFC